MTMSAKATGIFLLLLVLLAVPQAAPESDTVTCRKMKGECSFLLCPLFKRSRGTCYNGLAKCCRPFWIHGRH
ncbi:beta-defensin 1 [Coturnix japonica]|uniref:Beta-defensin-like domain-containing protein n=2 Tax=Coturnix japonica TaxID=93934 RepID=A0A8C2SMJ2_COTJA|nr:beta-defensin 1 [Coturnix japonica]